MNESAIEILKKTPSFAPGKVFRSIMSMTRTVLRRLFTKIQQNQLSSLYWKAITRPFWRMGKQGRARPTQWRVSSSL